MILPYEETEFFSKDLLGLNTLESKGRFFRCEVEGRHVQMKDEYYQLLVLPFLNIYEKDYIPLLSQIAKYCKFNWDRYFSIVN